MHFYLIIYNYIFISIIFQHSVTLMSKNIFKELKRWNICHCLLSQLAAALLNVPLCHHAANLPPGRLEVAFTHTQTHLDKAQVAGNVAINNTQGVTDSWRETLCVAVCVCECVIVFIMPERPSCHHLTRLLRWTHSIFYAHTRAPNPTQTQRTCVSNPQSVCVHKNTQRFKGKRCYNCPGPLSSKLWTHTLSLREFANLWVFDELWILCVCVSVWDVLMQALVISTSQLFFPYQRKQADLLLVNHQPSRVTTQPRTVSELLLKYRWETSL